jgi:hypothetical protein
LNYLRNFFYSFPIQLFLLHLKKHPLLLVFWMIVTGAASNSYLNHYGIPFLLLDPEYQGEVSFWSYLMVGFATGGFIMTWNTCFYMMNSYRFKFLATLARPFAKFCLNNFIIPLSFTLTYFITLIRFLSNQGESWTSILWSLSGLMIGQLVMVIFIILYFMLLNKNVSRFISTLTEKTKEQLEKGNIRLDILERDTSDASQWPVETYLSGLFSVRLVRQVEHYDNEIIRRVLNQHHNNSLVIIFISMATLLALSYGLDNPLFQFPAGAGMMLILSVMMAFACLITYWFAGWRVVAFVTFIAVINFISQFDLFVHKHRVAGLDYQNAVLRYNNRTVQEHVTETDINKDIREVIQILDRWQRKVQVKHKQKKPVMVFVMTAGGGMKSSYWAMHVLQSLERQTGEQFFDHVVLMSGASGGMLGASYFRELYLRYSGSPEREHLKAQYLEGAGRDLLNSVASAIAVNDIFFPWQRFEYNGQQFRKDRGYWFDRQLSSNTDHLLDKKVIDYRDAETQAKIPMMVLSPTIVNDQRMLLITAQPMSFLTKPYTRRNPGYLDYLSVDGIDFNRFFASRGAENLSFLTALRMNATYPYILPSSTLPTEPEMKVLDAGIRENHGYGISTRFANVFRSWIENYTSGVVFIHIRTDNKLKKLEENSPKSSFLDELTMPFGNIYSNFLQEQEYNNDQFVGMVANAMRVPVHVLNFSYKPSKRNEEASMSWHLTYREKQDIKEAFSSDENIEQLGKLKELLKVK